MTSGRTFRPALALGATTLMLGAAACGGSDKSSSSGASGSSASRNPTAPSGAGLDKAAAQYQSFVGGTAGKADASQSPFVVGFVNDEGGVPSFREGSAAADAAVKFVNEKLGGVGGHPLKLKKCLVSGSEEQGQA